MSAEKLTVLRSIGIGLTPVSLLASPCVLRGLYAGAPNNPFDFAYLKFYDTVSAPTVGTTTPSLTISCSAAAFESGMTWIERLRHAFVNGVWVAVTDDSPDSDASLSPTTVTVNAVVAV